MKLSEIKNPKASVGLEGWIAVPRGSFWQKDILNCWAFDTSAEMHTAINSDNAYRELDRSAGGYLVPIETLNNIHLIILMTSKGFHDTKSIEKETDKPFHVLAFSISEKSCRAAAEKAIASYGLEGVNDFWCYKTWNSDPAYFEDEE